MRDQTGCRSCGTASAALTISVIVPVHRGGEVFRRCLESIGATCPGPEEVIVVADGATDGSAELAESLGLQVVRTRRQRGPAVARNLGARAAKSDLLFFVDADVTVAAGAMAQVTQTFQGHPEIAALLGSYDDAPPATNFLSQYKNLVHHYVHQHAFEEGYTFWGACGAIRRGVFLEIGGFDETYRRPSIEDIELGYRLKAAGHRIRLCKQLQVKHHKRWTPVSLVWTDFCQRALPWTELILRRGRFENDLNIDRASRVKVALVVALLGAAGLSLWRPEGLILVALVGGALLALDRELWRFLWKKRGLRFTVRAIPWHCFYHGYCGLAFALGVARHLGRRVDRGGRTGGVIFAGRWVPTWFLWRGSDGR